MTMQEILAGVANGSVSATDAGKLIALLTPSAPQQAMVCKANPEKLTISLYGLQRMPITLHRSQWERLLTGCDRQSHPVLMFIDKHADYLPANKGDAAKPVPKALIGEGKDFRIPKGVEAAAV